MDFIAEIIANVLLLVGLFLVRWCKAHKQATLAIFVILMMIVDVIFKLFSGRIRCSINQYSVNIFGITDSDGDGHLDLNGSA